ncbi:MAG: hypothetical protein JRI68_18750 [Deltaproteobacteria bacterium]|nr:hypothetical protein [Deltaproteobacteria bacterium]
MSDSNEVLQSLPAARLAAVMALTVVSALALACSSSDDDGAGGSSTSTSGAGGVTSSGGGSGGTAGTGTGGTGTGGTGTGGGGGTPPGANNPDQLPESSSPIYTRDYETEVADDVTSTPNIALGEWGASHGHGPSGGWRFAPDPIVSTAGDNENSAGWAWGLQAGSDFPVGAYDLVTVSYMYRVSQALVQEIALAGAFWNHDQKAIDFKYHDPNAPYGEGNRNTIHFGESEGQVRFSHVDGGGGSRIYFGPDWVTLADEWVWLCHVIDMRGSSPAERYIATYIKRDGDPGVTRIGIRFENGPPELQAYNGQGVWGFLSPFHGYWDDMVDRNGLTHDLGQMFLSVDRLRVMPGWPDEANGPPF